METENDGQQFDYTKWLVKPVLETLFEEATSRITLGEFEDALLFPELLPLPIPLPPIHPSEENKELPVPDFERRRYNRPPVRIQSREDLIKERTEKWSKNINHWFRENKSMISRQKDRLRRQFQKGIDFWERTGRAVGVTADELVKKWFERNQDMTLPALNRLPITASLTTPFFVEIAEKIEATYGLTNSQNTSTKKGTKPVAPAPHSFVDLLANGFTKIDLDALLVYMLIKNKEGHTLPFKKYILHSVIEALQKTDFLEKSNQERDQKSLSVYLELPATRIKNGEGKDAFTAKAKAEKYLSVLKREREKNSSN